MLKRDLKLFLHCLSTASVLLLLTLALCIGAGFLTASLGERLYTPVRMAVVDGEDSFLSQVLIRTARNMTYIAALLDIETMTQEEASDAFANGTVEAVLYLPEHFDSDIMGGVCANGDLLLSDALAAHSGITAAVVRFGELLLFSGQYGAFGTEACMRKEGIGGAAYENLLDAVNAALLAEAMTADPVYFSVQQLDYRQSGLTMTGYFVSAWSIFLLLLLSVFFTPLFRRDCTQPMLQRLYAIGVTERAFLRWKLALTALLRLILLTVIFLVCISSGILPAPTGKSAVFLLLTVCYLTLLGAALTMCFENSVVSVCVTAGAGILFCGGLIPMQLLPDAWIAFGKWTPFGAAQACLNPALGSARPDIGGLLLAACYAGIAVFLLHLHMRRTLTAKQTLSEENSL